MWHLCQDPKFNVSFSFVDTNVEEQSSQGNYVPCPPSWPATGAVNNLGGPASARGRGGWRWRRKPAPAAAATATHHHCSGNGGGNLSGSTLFTSWCWRWWMKAFGGGKGGDRRQTTVLTAVKGKRVASSPIVVGGGKAIVSGQWTISGWRLVGGRIIY